MARSKFYEAIKSATIERQVEDVYNRGLKIYFPKAEITYPFNCDGYIDTLIGDKNLRLLIEYKFNENFQSAAGQAKVLAQVIYYLKAFETNGRPLPNIILIGDINECFVLQTNCLNKYLEEDLDWTIAPSHAAESNPQLILRLSQDEQINPFVYVINEDFSFKEVVEKIIDQTNNVQRYVRITEHNIATNYDYFSTRVIKHADKLTANQLVDIFLGTITDPENYYIHPTNPNKLVGKNLSVEVDAKAFTAFFGAFNREYTLKEMHRFAEISDRLIEETNRRRKGEFYTPTAFVDYAHQMLSEQLGDDWKEKYVVWDCCWGTGNLTRDYHFRELYASTLEQSELNIGEKYNREATKFVFDFLNDSIEGDLTGHPGVPQGLREALQHNKPILFFINPPYATANNLNKDGSSKKGVAQTNVNHMMLNENIGPASQNLYAQFMYSIMKICQHFNLTNANIGLFCKPLYLSSGSYKEFRRHFLQHFKYEQGILFNAGYFSGVSALWGINFSVWKTGNTIEKNAFLHSIIEMQDGSLISNGSKYIYNLDGLTSGSDWTKAPIKKLKGFDAPQFSSAIRWKEGKGCCGSLVPNALGYYVNVANNVYKSSTDVFLLSSTSSMGHGISIMPQNYIRVCANFSARKLIHGTWINDKDEYLAPNEQHEKWQEFVADSMVYSLFHSSSNQSSLRHVEYKDKEWDIRNEFFFMSKEEMMQLAEDKCLRDTYEDARTDHERFVYQRLCETSLSVEAQAVLTKARELTRDTMPYRFLFDQEHPEYQILNWDCGWYQIKAVVKQYMPKELDAFAALFKQLSDKMRPMVYELGFLIDSPAKES